MRSSIQRRRYVRQDGQEEEFILVSTGSFESPESVEQFGRELLQAASDWRAELATRDPPGEPAFKTFDFVRPSGGRHTIASWIEHPWALARHGGGTAPVFLVKAADHGAFSGWIVSVKLENREHRWRCRYDCASKIEARDLIHTFPYMLPRHPTTSDIDWARQRHARAASFANT
jgi:hypothetical protein